jgi:hypothetical protein
MQEAKEQREREAEEEEEENNKLQSSRKQRPKTGMFKK